MDSMYTQKIHVIIVYLATYICMIFMAKVGKNAVHGLHGMRDLINVFDMFISCGLRCVFRFQQAARAWIWFIVFLFNVLWQIKQVLGRLNHLD